MDNKLDKWWDHITYADAKKCIRENIQSLARNYIAIGFYLRRVRDEKLYLEDGYRNIHEFAYEEFGMQKSTVNHCIRINTEFSEDGNSPVIDARYKEFGKAQLQELLYVPEDKRSEVTPDMTVAEIRKSRKPKRLDVEPGKEEIERAAEHSAVKDVPAAVRQDPDEKLQGRKEAPIAQQGAPEIQEVAGEPIVQQHATVQQKILEGTRKCVTGWSKYGVCSCCGHGGVSCCNQCGESCNSRCGWIDDPYIPESGADSRADLDVIDTQYREETVEITAQGLLDRKQKELDEWMEATEQNGVAVIPPGVEELRIIVQALEILAGQQESNEEPEKMQEQPSLPVLKNNEQRKEWLSKYKEWGLWYEDTNIGAKYYRYRFENGADLIVEEYQSHSEYAGDYTTSYFHLVGGPKAVQKNGISKWQRNERYNKFPNSETELVEFLKFVQKGDK